MFKPAHVYYDRDSRLWVLTQGDSRKEFTPEEWRVICMVADQHMANTLYAYQRRDELRLTE